MIKTFLRHLAVGLTIATSLFSAPLALAQSVDVNASIDISHDPLGVKYPAKSGLSNTDIRIMVARIVKAALGFLGIIGVLLVIYAGFLWMTAGGSEEQIGTAKSIISASVVGLIIIFASYAIVTFVTVSLVNVTVSGDSTIPITP